VCERTRVSQQHSLVKPGIVVKIMGHDARKRQLKGGLQSSGLRYGLGVHRYQGGLPRTNLLQPACAWPEQDPAAGGGMPRRDRHRVPPGGHPRGSVPTAPGTVGPRPDRTSRSPSRVKQHLPRARVDERLREWPNERDEPRASARRLPRRVRRASEKAVVHHVTAWQ
jgi:hypothetical protein